jgi:nucleolar complex protein 2
MVKTLLERVEESAKWVERRRKEVVFGPGKMALVSDWEKELKSQLKDAPLSKYLKVQLKAREKRRKLLEKVRHANGLKLALSITFLSQARVGEDEILEED